MILIKDNTKLKLLFGVITSAAIILEIATYAVSSSEKADLSNSLVGISNELSDIKAEIQNQKKFREDYDKRFQELADKIAEIDKQFEEVHNETYTETIIFEVPMEETEPSKERLPAGVDTNRYDCEPYTFGAGSDQYYLQLECFTDKRGLRYFYHNGNKYYCVAMGGAYGIDIGDTWNVTLECGTEFGIILSDFQHAITDIDPNDFGERYTYDSCGNVVDVLRNYDGEPVVHVLEFVVDIELIPKSVLRAGTISKLEEFGGLYGNGGNIIDISYNGRLWSV